jgi:7-cyano-7-deazaguanine reductase
MCLTFPHFPKPSTLTRSRPKKMTQHSCRSFASKNQNDWNRSHRALGNQAFPRIAPRKNNDSDSKQMSQTNSPDLTLLGHSEMRLPAHPGEAKLEAFPNRSPGRNYVIQLEYPDFTSLCPVTGQPDAARISIRYIPDQSCVETKSLKFYLASYRNTASFNEEIVNRILDDLVAVCEPVSLNVTGVFRPRGGIRLTCFAQYPDPGPEALGNSGMNHKNNRP